MPSPPPEHDAHGPRLLGSELQATRCCHRETNKLANHGSKPAEGQPLFHGGQRLLFAVAFAKDDAIRMEPRLGNGGKKQVRARHAPEHLAPRPGSDACHEERRRGPVDRPSTATSDFMQRTESEPSARQCPVDLGNTERQDLPRALRAAFQLADTLAKLRQDGVEGMIGHGRIVAPSGFAAVFQADMFIICSDCSTESIGPPVRKMFLG